MRDLITLLYAVRQSEMVLVLQVGPGIGGEITSKPIQIYRIYRLPIFPRKIEQYRNVGETRYRDRTTNE